MSPAPYETATGITSRATARVGDQVVDADRLDVERLVTVTIVAAVMLFLEPLGPERFLLAGLAMGWQFTMTATVRWLLRPVGADRLGAYLLLDSVIVGLSPLLIADTWFPTVVMITYSVAVNATYLPNRWLTALVVQSLVIVGLTSWLLRPQGALPVVLILAILLTHALTQRSSAVAIAEASLQEAEDLLDTVDVVVWETAAAGSVIQVRGRIDEVLGYTKDEWSALDPRSLIHPDDLPGAWSLEHPVRLKDRRGEWRWVRLTRNQAHDRNGNEVDRWMLVDVTPTVVARNEAERRAFHDQLTGLGNRARLARLVDQRAGDASAGLLLLDIDNFKEINDTLGHRFGDLLLATMARRFESITGAVDRHVCRLGGDEFAIVMFGGPTSAELEEMATAADAAARSPLVLDGVAIETSASIGITTTTDGSLDEALRQADVAMYRSKRSGEGWVWYSPDQDRHSVERLQLLSDLPGAIARGELQPWFQPKVDLATGALVGAEALVRWRHPTLGLLTPDRFIELVGLAGAHAALSSSVLGQAVQAASNWPASLDVSVNLSAAEFMAADLDVRVTAALDAHALPPTRLILEITEDDAPQDGAALGRALAPLAALGVRFSMDDFGTGHSALARLRTTPVDEVKVDRSFVAGIASDASDRILVKTMIDMAVGLGHEVTAEGVEDNEQAAILAAMGCHTGQGFLWSPAVPPADFARLIEAWDGRISAPSWESDDHGVEPPAKDPAR